MKNISIIGACPQFIKCVLLSRELRKKHKAILIHRGQHYDMNMSDIFFKDLGIPKPDYNLEIGSATREEQIGSMLVDIGKLLIEEQSAFVFVYGNTNSTLAVSKIHIKMAHVEAWSRSLDRTMLGELNKVLTDHFPNLLFCPTDTAVANLKSKGITSSA